MKKSNLILMVLLVCLIGTRLGFGQKHNKENFDTVWIHQGIEYDYNPLNESPAQPTSVAITDNSDFRILVDSLGTHSKLTFDRDELSDQILKNDTLFKEYWFPEDVLIKKRKPMFKKNYWFRNGFQVV